jgi:hypothetical protein
MYLDFPQSWIQEPVNYTPNINFTLSKKDKDNVFKLFGDPNYKDNLDPDNIDT